MKQKIFLTSALAMGFVLPAMAEDFPSNGLMQQNKTYDNAATSTNMDGVYEGTVNAVAEYDTIDYILSAGKYLPADSETITTCPEGSFCSGGTTVQYNQNLAQGIETCPSEFASSASGSSSNTQCYRACDINNMGENGSIANISHAIAISGNDYYGAGTDTCEPTACENGWHLKQGLNLTTAIGTGAGTSRAHINKGSFSEDGASHGQSYYGISDNNTWAVDYGTNGMLIGQGRCSTQRGNNSFYQWTSPTIKADLTDETGQTGAKYCYCNVTGYKDTNGNMQSLSSAWVFQGDDGGGVSACAGNCGYRCAYYMRIGESGGLAFRAAVLGAVESIPAMCEANVININWNDVDPEYAGQNNEDTAVYGEDVRTPVKAATKKGKTFRGWRFSAPEQTTTGNNG
jgi:hypothetical protein